MKTQPATCRSSSALNNLSGLTERSVIARKKSSRLLIQETTTADCEWPAWSICHGPSLWAGPIGHLPVRRSGTRFSLPRSESGRGRQDYCNPRLEEPLRRIRRSQVLEGSRPATFSRRTTPFLINRINDAQFGETFASQLRRYVKQFPRSRASFDSASAETRKGRFLVHFSIRLRSLMSRTKACHRRIRQYLRANLNGKVR